MSREKRMRFIGDTIEALTPNVSLDHPRATREDGSRLGC